MKPATGSKDRAPRKPAEPANDPLPFIEFVAKHPVGSTLEGVVETFSSHGAYVAAGGARCYVPLKLMGDPAPRAARDVMVVGETRKFAVHSLDTPRRGIDLALVADGIVRRETKNADSDDTDASAAKSQQSQGSGATGEIVSRQSTGRGRRSMSRKTSTNDAVVGTTSPPDQHAEEATVTPAAKKAPAKKAAAKKAPAKKTVAKKTAAKKTVAKKAPAKKAPAKKTVAKKAPAKKAPAKKTVAKKAPAKKAPAKKTVAKKAPARKAPAKKTVAKKAPAEEGPRQEGSGQEDGCEEGTGQEGPRQEDDRPALSLISTSSEPVPRLGGAPARPGTIPPPP